MKLKLVQLLMAGSVVLLISCNPADNSSMENTIKELRENQNIIQEQIVTLKELQKNQKDIQKKLQTIDKSIANLTLASKNRPASKKQQPPKADPNKVYNIDIGDSFTIGPDDAKVTIIEWMDFQ